MYYLIKSKGCRRCGGDLFLERYEDSVYVTCLQCSAIHAEFSERELKNSKSPLLAKAGQGNKGY